MADVSVERARYRNLATSKAQAQKSKASQGTLDALGRKARRFAFPLMLAAGLSAGSPQSQDNQLPDDEIAQLAAQESLLYQQAQARVLQTQQRQIAAQRIAAGAVASRYGTAAALVSGQARNKRRAAAAKKRDEDTRRKAIRPAQASLFSGSVLGAETVILLILGGGTWLTWKGLELYKTVTGADLNIFEKSVVTWNFRDKLEFIMGALALLVVGFITIGIIAVVGYYIVNPTEVTNILPLIAEILKLVF